MADLTGQVLGERYQVEDFLGRGGMADVYKVRDLQRAVFLAMKVLHSDLARDQIFWKRFEREAHTLELLQHPNIVRFYGLEKAGRLSFILMDYIDGLTLSKELFLYKNPLPPARVLEIAGPVCAALYFAHNMGMVHCDIKPGNIMIHRNGTVYLTDFGIARVQKSNTQPLTGAGTPTYMAPEQFDAQKPSPATDIYALGVVLFEMLTGGKRPYTGDEAEISGPPLEKIVWEKRSLPIPSPRKYNPQVSAEMQAVVMHCLETDPQRRFPTALDLLQALEKAAGGSADDDEAETRVDLPKKTAGTAHPARAAGEKRDLPPLPPSRFGKGEEEKNLPSPVPLVGTPSRVEKGRDGSREGVRSSENVDKEKGPAGGPLTPDQTPPSPGKPSVEAGKTRSSTSRAAPAAGSPLVEEKSQPADKTPAGEPTPPAARKTAARRTPAKRAAQSPAGASPTGAAPEAKSPGAAGRPQGRLPGKWWRGATWLTVLAAGAALALIGLALFYGRPPAAMPTRTPTTASLWSVSPTAALLPPTAAPAAPPTPTALPAPVDLPTAAAPTPASPGTAAAGQATPRGGRGQVAFASDRSGSLQIWVMDPADPDNPNKRQQITDVQGGACQPAWSPDAAQIAFTTPCKGPSVYYPSATIKIIRLADKTVTDLPVKTPGIAGAFDPAWSPDGLTLAYTAILGEKTEIRAINLNNQQVTTLTSRGTRNTQPAWSPDGKHIAYVFSDSDKNWDTLWSMTPTGESQEPLARAERFAEPAWSPDGAYLLASVNRGDNIPLLALIDGSNPNQSAALLLRETYRMSHASFSPDGQWVVFWTEQNHNKPEIMLASTDGKQVIQLTNNNMSDFQPAWSAK